MTDISNGLLKFTIDLYKQLTAGGDNIFISPYSVSCALFLADLGADGSTEQQIRTAFGFGHLSKNDTQQAVKSLRSALLSSPGSSTQLHIANRIFSKLGLDVSKQYEKDAKALHDSKLQPLDFENKAEESREIINKWVEEKTNKKIKDLLQKGVIDSMSLLVLVNAIYFKGKWLTPFRPTGTKKEDFHVTKSEKKPIDMMHMTEDFAYYADGNLQCSAVQLPYKDQKTAMVFILPNQVDGLSQLEKSLTSENIGAFLKKLDSVGKEEVVLGVPKFKMTATYDMKEPLKGLGITDMMVAGRADFSKMIPKEAQAYISDVIHKAFIEVDEEGTEAAAATAMIMALGCAFPPKPPVRFILDHPFLFMIREKQSGTILFMGRFTNPPE